jgi:putative ABC transport system permease protein
VLAFVAPYAYNFMAIRTTANDLSVTTAGIEDFWKKSFPGYPFEYFMLDDDFNLQYKSEARLAKVTSLFSVLTILIASLGLFGLVAYATQQRVKEIGVRKVLGATASNITVMLSKDFLKLVLIAACIAIPAGWFVMNKWLEDFAYRINISWWMFVVAGLGALIVALLTVSFQAIKAALANPVKSLRTE